MLVQKIIEKNLKDKHMQPVSTRQKQQEQYASNVNHSLWSHVSPIFMNQCIQTSVM